MATTRTPARKTTRRRAPQKKGLSTTAKIAIGVGVAAGAWLIYDQFFKVTKPAPPMVPDTKTAQDLIDAAQQIPPNMLPQPAPRQLSPLNTSSKDLKWNSIQLFYGDKGGEIQEMQKLFNAISSLYNQPTIKVDGQWGPETEKKKIKIMGQGKGFTLMSVYKIFKANAQSAKKGGEWGANDSDLNIMTNAIGGYSW